MENLNFGKAIEAMQQGKKVCRAGWNGKGMFLFLLHGPLIEKIVDENYNHIFTDNSNTPLETLDCFCMKTADNKICVGWLASQTDMLASDWQIM